MSGFDNTSYTVRTSAATTETVLATDSVVIYTNSAAKTVTLPAVAVAPPGRVYQFVCQNTGVLTLHGNASENINGSNTFAVTAGTVGGVTGRVGLVSDGTQWFTLYSQ